MYIYIHWQPLCTITRFVPIYRPLCPLTGSCVHLHVRVPTDTLFCPLADLCAHLHALVPTGRSLCPLTGPCAHWHAFMPTDTPLYPLTSPCAHWYALMPTTLQCVRCIAIMYIEMPSTQDILKSWKRTIITQITWVILHKNVKICVSWKYPHWHDQHFLKWCKFLDFLISDPLRGGYLTGV